MPLHRILNNSSLQAIGKRMGQEKVCQKSLLLEKGFGLWCFLTKQGFKVFMYLLSAEDTQFHWLGVRNH